MEALDLKHNCKNEFHAPIPLTNIFKRLLSQHHSLKREIIEEVKGDIGEGDESDEEEIKEGGESDEEKEVEEGEKSPLNEARREGEDGAPVLKFIHEF